MPGTSGPSVSVFVIGKLYQATQFGLLQIEQKLFPDQARSYEAMSRLSILVRYDHRGFGLSDRSITTFPLDGP